ncbi:MAG: class I SAM-dependent methyltransferase [Pseudomonadota bacterium]
MPRPQCPTCLIPLVNGLTSWHFRCHKCQYECSNLKPEINKAEIHKQINEDDRENGLRKLRQQNFSLILKRIKKHKPSPSARLLDVGAAHGWFLDLASPLFLAEGIEPDQALFQYAKSKGNSVRLGYFPEALLSNECFDVIIFNDVIEHIPDINFILQACYDRLNKDGLLILNLPNSQGFFYRLSKILALFGLTRPFERLWQKGFPSPHVHYFNGDNLVMLGLTKNFLTLEKAHLPSLTFNGLFTRIAYDQNNRFLTNICLFLLIAPIVPLLKVLPKDIFFVIFKKINQTRH